MRDWAKSAVGKPGNRACYLPTFRRHVHEILYMGYRRLDYAQLTSSEEPEITGELVRAMREAMQDGGAPHWVVNYALPKDDPPLNVEGRLGKRRPRADIEFERTQLGPRPVFRFEAKRLNGIHPVSAYLGPDGLGCFVSGRYPADGEEAGMLGYVQSDDEATWADRINSCISSHRRQYALRPDGTWRKVAIVSGLGYTYRTRHDRPSPLPPITIGHVLLRFCRGVHEDEK